MKGNDMNSVVTSIVNSIRGKTGFVPKVALTLGSGLGGFADEIEIECEIDYKDIPGFPVSTAPGHAGRLIFGMLGKVPVVCMQGRIHYYEGQGTDKVVLPVRVMHALGAEILFLTNAAGGINPSYHAGELVLVTDHISCLVPNPLNGPNDEDEGVRFPDMTHVYDENLRDIIHKAARKDGIELGEGVYVQFQGPSYETPAEIRMAAAMGGDIAGMSTAMEAIVARHCGMRVCCVSLISNLAAGISPKPLSSEEVLEAGNEAAPKFTKLVRDSIEAFL